MPQAGTLLRNGGTQVALHGLLKAGRRCARATYSAGGYVVDMGEVVLTEGYPKLVEFLHTVFNRSSGHPNAVGPCELSLPPT